MTLDHHNTEIARSLRHAANVLEAYPEIPHIVSVQLKHSMFPYSEEEKDKAKNKVVKFVRAMKHKFKVEKKYYGDFFSANVKLNKHVTVSATTNRDTVCTVVNTTTKYVPPMEGYYKEEHEWDCEPLLAEGDN